MVRKITNYKISRNEHSRRVNTVGSDISWCPFILLILLFLYWFFFPNYYLLRLVVCPLLSGMAHCTNVLWWDFNLFMMTLFLPLPMGKIKLNHSSSGLLQLHILSVWCLSQLAYWWSHWLRCILVCISMLLAL